MEKLHLDHERRPRSITTPHVQDRQLCAGYKRKLLARQVFDPFDRAVALPIEKVVQQAAEDIRVLGKDAPENKVVLQIREDHALSLPEFDPGHKGARLRVERTPEQRPGFQVGRNSP
jgi:hypothetical protein